MSSLIAGRATMWSALDVVIRQLTQFALAVVLARLLTPADFGAVAVLLVFSSVAQAFIMTGLTTPLVQQETSLDQQSTIFWCALGLGILFYVAMAALGPVFARFYGIAELRWLILSTAGIVVLLGFSGVPVALLTRAFRFRDIAFASIAGSLVSGLVGVALGFAGAGPWALAGSLLTFYVVSTIIVWRVSDWRPARVFRLKAVAPMLRFGSWLSLSGVLDVLYSQGFALVLGKFYGLRDLGLYTRANNLQTIPGTTINAIVGRVTLPFFSARGTDHDGLVRALLRTNRLTMLINLPIAVGLIVTANLTILVLFGPQWVEAAPVLTVLAAAGALLPLQVTNQQMLLARGKSGLYFRVEVAKKLIGIPLLIAGSFFGLMGLAWAQLLATTIGVSINLWPNGRDLGCGIGRQLADLASLIAASAVMGAVVLWLRSVTDLPPAPELLLLVSAGAATYLAAGMALRSEAMVDAAHLAVGLWRTRRHPAQAGQP
jgi:teichuronic acid exporter